MRYVNHDPLALTKHLLELSIEGLRQGQPAGLTAVTTRDVAKWLFDPNEGPLREEG